MQAEARLKGRQAAPALRARKRQRRVPAAQRGLAGEPRVIRLALGRVPDRHDRVADVFVDRPAAIAVNDPRHHLEITAQRVGQLVRRQLLGGRGEILDVGEHDRDLGQLAAQHRLALLAEKLSHEIERHVLAHRPHGVLRLLKTLQHLADVAEDRLGWRRRKLERVHLFAFARDLALPALDRLQHHQAARQQREHDGERGEQQAIAQGQQAAEVMRARHDNPDDPILRAAQRPERHEVFPALVDNLARDHALRLADLLEHGVAERDGHFARHFAARDAQVVVVFVEHVIRHQARHQPALGVADENPVRIVLSFRGELDSHGLIELTRQQSHAQHAEKFSRRVLHHLLHADLHAPLLARQSGVELRPMQIAPQHAAKELLLRRRHESRMHRRILQRALLRHAGHLAPGTECREHRP